MIPVTNYVEYNKVAASSIITNDSKELFGYLLSDKLHSIFITLPKLNKSNSHKDRSPAKPCHTMDSNGAARFLTVPATQKT